MEDLDAPRVLPGSADDILRTLEAFGLHWDGAVEYQSRATALYELAFESLRAQGLTFECNCSRRQLAGSEESGYPGTCRAAHLTLSSNTASRFRVDDAITVEFIDRIQGPCRCALQTMGDVVIRRRDGLFAYQLAVVVDDARQAITDVVRGADLLPSTAWQIALQDTLSLQRPRYAHLPLLTEPDGAKLAKSTRSVAVDPTTASETLLDVLRLMRQKPPDDLRNEAASDVLKWAINHWNPQPLAGIRDVRLAG